MGQIYTISVTDNKIFDSVCVIFLTGSFSFKYNSGQPNRSVIQSCLNARTILTLMFKHKYKIAHGSLVWLQFKRSSETVFFFLFFLFSADWPKGSNWISESNYIKICSFGLILLRFGRMQNITMIKATWNFASRNLQFSTTFFKCWERTRRFDQYYLTVFIMADADNTYWE